MHKIICSSFKGGVGKTTSTVNLAHALALMKHKILVIDLDRQGNTTSHFGFEIENDTPTLYHLMKGEVDLKHAVSTVRENLDLIPSNGLTEALEEELSSRSYRESILKRAISKSNEYDYVLMDPPPFYNLIHRNGIVCATHLIVPIETAYFSLEGVADIMSKLGDLAAGGPIPEVVGCVLTKVDERLSKTANVRNHVNKSFAERILGEIRTDTQIDYAQQNGETAFEYNLKGKTATDYWTVAEELVKRLPATQKAGTEETAYVG